MKNFRYNLEKYSGPSSRYICPQCGQKEFVRYIDNETKNHLNENVGRCNRIEKCGYHFTPKMYFDKSGILPGRTLQIINKAETKSIGYCDEKLVLKSLQTDNKKCNLFQFLVKHFDETSVRKSFQKYFVGVSNKWNNATLFWQIDNQKRIRCGKIMHYNTSTGKREKNKFSWVKNEDKQTEMQQCFFGLHLIDYFPNYTIGIVESEKTAMIAELFFQENMIWLASGGLNGLNQDKFNDLIGRKIILFPDLSSKDSQNSAYYLWKFKAKEISKNLKMGVKINNYLELISSDFEKENQFDLADFIIQNQKLKASQNADETLNETIVKSKLRMRS